MGHPAGGPVGSTPRGAPRVGYPGLSGKTKRCGKEGGLHPLSFNQGDPDPLE